MAIPSLILGLMFTAFFFMYLHGPATDEDWAFRLMAYCMMGVIVIVAGIGYIGVIVSILMAVVPDEDTKEVSK